MQKMFIDGQFVASASGEVIEVTDPATEEMLDVVPKGTPEDVERDIKEHMDVLKPGGRWVAGSSHSIVNYIPHENFVTMINAIHKYGAY